MTTKNINALIIFVGLWDQFFIWSLADENSTSSTISDRDNVSKPYTQFLHVSDFHIDPNYEKHLSCKTTPNHTQEYGDYLCDSPKVLVKSAIKYMKKKFPNPDFILWTGMQSK